MDQRDRLIKALNKKLNHSERDLFRLVTIENRKDGLTVRMPVGVISLEGVWEKILEVGNGLNIKCVKAGEFATLEELDDILGDIQWLWDGWIPKGFVTMWVGDPGRGKSAVMQHLAKIVTEGGTFPLDEKPLSSPGKVIWVDTEASQQILKVRAGLMEIDKSRIYLPVINGDILSQANLGSGEDRQQIINLIEGVEPDMLVLDSLGGSHAGGENKVEDIRPILEFLALLSRDYQMAVSVVHHLNKNREGEAAEVSLYRIRGSTVIPAYCRSIISLEASHNNTNMMRVIKSNLALHRDPISVIPLLNEGGNIYGFEYQPYQAPPNKKNKKEVCADWVYGTLNNHKEGVLLTQLIEDGMAKGFSRQNIYSAREILGDRITFGGNGSRSIWMVTSADNATINKIVNSSNGKHAKGKNNVRKDKRKSK